MHQQFASGSAWGRAARLVLASAAALTAVLIAGCGSTDSSGASKSGGANGPEAKDAFVGSLPKECSRVTPFQELQSAPKPSQRWKITVILPHEQDGGTKTAAFAAVDEGKALGVDVSELNAGGYQNVARQIGMIQTAIAEKPDALVVWATDPTATAPYLVKAKEAGIKTIGWISPPRSQLDKWPARGKVDALITGDYENNAYEEARCLGLAIGGKGDVLSVVAGAGSAFNHDEIAGTERGFGSLPGINLVQQKSIEGFDAESTQRIVQDALTRFPDIKAIHTTTISMAQGAVAALRQRGLAGKVAVGGLDVTTPDDIDLLRSHEITFLMGERPAFWGKAAVRAAVTLLEGQKLPEDELFLTANPIYTDADSLIKHLDDELHPSLQGKYRDAASG